MILNQVNTHENHNLTKTQKRRIRRKKVQERSASRPQSMNLVEPQTPIFLNSLIQENKNTSKEQTIDVKNTTTMSDKIIEKSKDEVKAAREAKKLAKQNAKNKKPDANKQAINVTETSKPVTKTVKDLTSNPVTSSDQVDTQNAKTKKSEPTSPEGNTQVIKSKETTKPETKAVKSTDEVDRAHLATDSMKAGEMSRDLVKAEREAKKLAKQMAKKKTNEKDLDNTKEVVIKENVSVIHKNIDEIKEIVNQFKEKKPFIIKEDNLKKQPDSAEKSKAELRAERRAKQEAQRAAKEATKVPEIKAKTTTKEKATADPEKEIKQVAVKIVEKVKPKAAVHKVKLFQHLYTESIGTKTVKIPFNSKELHPAVLRLGVKMATRVVRGSNARCIALLNTLNQVIRDYALPAKTDFARGLESHLATCLSYLSSMRPPASSMTNAVKHLRWQLSQLPNSVNEFDAKSTLIDAIDTYITDQIEVAGEAISITVRNKISNGDSILTYGCSSLIERILKEAWSSGLNFRTVIVGSRSNRDGQEMLRRLSSHGLACTYINISAINYLMRSVNKVILGAGALLGNGWVLGRAGTAQVALAAAAHNVPVLVCCETHKFSERVQTDAFVFNEIGDPDDLIDRTNEKSPLRDWRSYNCLTPLNLEYDVTPPKLVTAVVTELAILPCTSAPVVLRTKLSEYGM